jgi:hypothetical protein
MVYLHLGVHRIILKCCDGIPQIRGRLLRGSCRHKSQVLRGSPFFEVTCQGAQVLDSLSEEVIGWWALCRYRSDILSRANSVFREHIEGAANTHRGSMLEHFVLLAKILVKFEDGRHIATADVHQTETKSQLMSKPCARMIVDRGRRRSVTLDLA